MGEINDIIIEQINLKKKEGYKFLYDNYYSSLCNFSSNFLNQKTAAEDVVQDVIMNLWRGDANFNSEKALTAYLYNCVKNASLNAIRNNTKWSGIDISNQNELANFRIDDKSIQQVIIEEEYYRQIYVAIDKLSPERKKVIMLSMEGLTNREIAEKAGVSVNTVKTLKLKAYRFLRTELELPAFLLLLQLLN